MHDVVELVRALAWPATILCIVLLLRKELRMFTMNVATRARTDTIVIGRSGVTIKAPLSSQLQARKISFRRFVVALADTTVLSIAGRLELPTGVTPAAARKALIAEMNRRVSTDQDMDQFSAMLKRIT